MCCDSLCLYSRDPRHSMVRLALYLVEHLL